MRLFLIVANTILLLCLLFFFREEMRHTTRIDWVAVAIFFYVVSLTCLNIGYVVATRTDKAFISRVNRFIVLWKRSAGQVSSRSRRDRN